MTMKNTVVTLQKQKHEHDKITMVTAYDYTTAKIMDESGVNTILVGDSLGMVMLGYEDTLSVTMEDMIHHTAAVTRGAKNAFVVADMPFMSYQTSVYDAVVNAGHLMKEGRANAVKLEGGVEFAPHIKAIAQASIPVVAHLGLTPQSVNAFGGFKVQGKDIEAAQKLIEYSGGYIAAPSANTSGKPSPTVAKYVVEDMMGRIDAIIDGGEVGIGLESTIIDLTVSPPQILRPGYITREKLSAVLGTVDTDATILRADSGQAPKAPGMKYRHYAPRGELTIVEGTPEQVREYINREASADHAAGEKTGIIGTEEMLSGYTADVVKSVGSRRDEDSIARHLYTILREFDDEGVTKIYSEGFSTDGFGQAIMNRLLKAAGHKVVKL